MTIDQNQVRVARKRLSDLFDAAPWLKEDSNCRSCVPGCLELTWGDLWLLHQLIEEASP